MEKVLQLLKLNLLHMGYAKLTSSWNYDNVISPFSRMYYITKGEAKIYHHDQVFILKPGYLYLIPSYSYSKYQCDDYHEQYYISFFEDIFDRVSIYGVKQFEYEIEALPVDLNYFKRLLEIYGNSSLINDDPKVYDTSDSFMNDHKSGELLTASAYLEAQGILYLLFSRFIKNENVKEFQNESKIDLNTVLSRINYNLHNNITVEQLAASCHLSTDYFSRIFNQRFGMRPNKYIQTKRIERAQFLLLTTTDALQQIAEKVGLSNISYFSRTFKKITGKTPGMYRKELLKA